MLAIWEAVMDCITVMAMYILTQWICTDIMVLKHPTVGMDMDKEAMDTEEAMYMEEAMDMEDTIWVDTVVNIWADTSTHWKQWL